MEPPSPPSADSLLTVDDIARILKLNPQTVRNWIDRGYLGAIRIGRRVRIPRAEFDRLIAESYTDGSEGGQNRREGSGYTAEGSGRVSLTPGRSLGEQSVRQRPVPFAGSGTQNGPKAPGPIASGRVSSGPSCRLGGQPPMPSRSNAPPSGSATSSNRRPVSGWRPVKHRACRPIGSSSPSGSSGT